MAVSRHSLFSNKKISDEKLSSIPAKIKKYDIVNLENHKEYVAQVKEALREQKNGYYPKRCSFLTKIQSKYSIIKQNKHHYLVLPGKKYKSHIHTSDFSITKYGMNMDNGMPVVIKVYNGKLAKSHLKLSHYRSLTQIMYEDGRLPSYPSDIPTTDTLYVKKYRGSNDSKPKKFVLIMQLEQGMDGRDILWKVQDKPSKKLNLYDLLTLLLNMMKEVMRLHEKNILHCDIKPENFMHVMARLSARIIDFDFAIKNGDIGNFLGTAGYYAPELYEHRTKELEEKDLFRHSKKSDVYSLGITLIEYADTLLNCDQGKKSHHLELCGILRKMIHYTPSIRIGLDKAFTELTALQKKCAPVLEEENLFQTHSCSFPPRSAGEG